MPFPSFLTSLSSILQGGVLLLLSFFIYRFNVRGLALHRIASPLVLCFWFCLPAWVRKLYRQIKRRTKEGVEPNRSRKLFRFDFFWQRIVLTWCFPRMSSAAIWFYIDHTLLQSCNSFLCNFNRFISELMNSLWFFSRLMKSIYFLLLLPWELKRQQINKTNKLEHLDLIVYWTGEYLNVAKNVLRNVLVWTCIKLWIMIMLNDKL